MDQGLCLARSPLSSVTQYCCWSANGKHTCQSSECLPFIFCVCVCVWWDVVRSVQRFLFHIWLVWLKAMLSVSCILISVSVYRCLEFHVNFTKYWKVLLENYLWKRNSKIRWKVSYNRRKCISHWVTASEHWVTFMHTHQKSLIPIRCGHTHKSDVIHVWCVCLLEQSHFCAAANTRLHSSRAKWPE